MYYRHRKHPVCVCSSEGYHSTVKSEGIQLSVIHAVLSFTHTHLCHFLCIYIILYIIYVCMCICKTCTQRERAIYIHIYIDIYLYINKLFCNLYIFHVLPYMSKKKCPSNHSKGIENILYWVETLRKIFLVFNHVWNRNIYKSWRCCLL